MCDQSVTIFLCVFSEAFHTDLMRHQRHQLISRKVCIYYYIKIFSEAADAQHTYQYAILEMKLLVTGW